MLYNRQHFVYLFKRYSKFTFLMTGRNLQVTTRHNIGAQADAYRVTMTEFFAELLQVGKAVNINMYTQLLRGFNLGKRQYYWEV